MTSDRMPEESAASEAVAIVGVGCKLPGNISSIEHLFEALREGRDCVTEIPPDRWGVDEYYDPDTLASGKSYVRWGGFVTDIDRFDAGFFGISDAEAARMDPQQRMVLQTVWHALEDAGQSAEELQGSNTGVFLAMMNTNDYCQLKGTFEGLQGVTGYDAMGDAISIAAGRVSHFLDIHGPCIALDTACSGSLVALHLARQHILSGDCDAAIVAGVSAILHPGIYIAFSKVGLMSRSGRCRTFDEAADGYIRGEGCTALLLRRQSDALARGDRILATIAGTAINQDGRTPALTAPNGQAQERVMRLALARVGASASKIGYVEAHGTGTPVGDPIEMKAITNVYGVDRDEQNTLFVGSVKSNFGHMESGAGLLSVVKTALSLDREVIFPSLHFNRLNPNIDLGRVPVRVPISVIPWRRGERRRLAGVNSFGYSGTNAHAVLQEAQLPEQEKTRTRPAELVVLSAKTIGSLQESADKWVEFLTNDASTPIGDIAFTAAVGRSHFRHRLAVVGEGKAEIGAKLRLWREGRTPSGLATGHTSGKRGPKIAFMFTGQGAQYTGMGRELYETEPRFKAAVDRCAAFMDLEAPLHDVLFGASSSDLLSDTRFVQPALFAIEYALTELLAHWGVQPDFVLGHSVGEMAAACAAGMLDVEQAARFVSGRARAMSALPREGKMLAVEAPLVEVSEWIQGRDGDVSIAAINGPLNVVVSGKANVIDAIAQVATTAGRRTKALATSHAFHSPLMDPALSEINRLASAIRVSRARLPLASNVTGDYLDDDVDSEYWGSQMRQPVLFHKGITRLIDAGCSVLVEIGPHPALIPSVNAAFDASKAICVPTLKRDRKDISHVLETLASLHVIGVPVRLDSLFRDGRFRRVPLPLYSFRRDRHWLWSERPVVPQPGLQHDPPNVKADLHPLVAKAVIVDSRRVVFETKLNATSPWVDHRVLGSTVFPATAYVEMAARGFAAINGQDWRSVVLRDLTFERPLVLKYGKSKNVRLTLNNIHNAATSGTSFAVSANGSDREEIYCRGRIAAGSGDMEHVAMESVLGKRESGLAIGPFYGELRNQGLEYGANFSTIRDLWIGKPESGEAIGCVKASRFENESDGHPFANTVLLDGCLQVFGAALRTFTENRFHGAFVPASLRSFTIKRELPTQVWSHVTVQPNNSGGAALVRVQVFSETGEVLADIDGLELRRKSNLTPDTSDRPATSRSENSEPTGASESRAQLIERLRVLPKDQRTGVLVSWVVMEVKDIMGQAAEEMDIDSIDPSRAFLEIGLDSLLITELQRRVQEKLEFRFQPMQALDYQSIESLAGYILEEILNLDSAETAAAKGAPAN